MVKNAACDVATGRTCSLQIQFNGATKTLLSAAVITLTAERVDKTITFNTPIKVDKNTAVVLSGAFTAGSMVRCCEITGFLVSN